MSSLLFSVFCFACSALRAVAQERQQEISERVRERISLRFCVFACTRAGFVSKTMFGSVSENVIRRKNTKFEGNSREERMAVQQI